MSKLLIFILIIVGISLSGSSYSQERNIEYISVDQGLPQSSVSSVLIDSRGFLWLGTIGGGLAMYDGSSFIIYDEKSGLSGNIVNDIVEDNKGRILCATSWGGYTIIENTELTLKSFPEAKRSGSILSLVKDSYGNIWGVGNELMWFNGQEFEIIETDIKLPFINEPKLATKGDLLYVTTNNTLLTIDIKEKKQISSATFKHPLMSICVTSRKKIILGTAQHGVFQFENNKLIPLQITDKFLENINIISESPSGDLWIGGDKDVYISSKNGGIYDSLSPSLGLSSSNDFCFDAQGNSWIGASGYGVAKVTNTPFYYFDDVEGLSLPNNYPIYEDLNGNLFVGNIDKGLFKFNNGVCSVIDTSKGMLSNNIRVIYPFEKSLYVGTSKGVNVLEDGEVSEISFLNGMNVKSMVADESGNFYFGTIGNGLIQRDALGEFSKLSDSGVSDNIYSLNFVRDYGVLVGTNDGIHGYKSGTFTKFSKNLPNSYIGGITIDKHGKFWISTDRGIACWNGSSFETYNVDNGLLSDVVYSILSDNNGFIWVGTNKGLNKLTIDFDSKVNKIKAFGYNEGFKGVECNTGGIFENKKGNIYFSTIKGIHKYEPDFDYYQSYKTPIYIQNVRLFLSEFDYKSKGNDIINYFNVPKQITLEANENHITIDFFAIDFIRGKNIQYVYYLEGFDKNWSPPTKSRYAVYSNLSPGYYTFKVKVAGNEFSEIAELKIVILRSPPPFYKRSSFLILIFLIIGFLVYYFTVFRNKQLIRQSLLLERKVEERTFQILEREGEKTILLQEVHHRVKNNLQIIISLFRLQSHFTENEEAKELFLNSQNRIRSMSKIHEKLYQTKDLSKIEVHIYLKELIAEIIQSYDTQNRVELISNIQPCQISIDELTPLALIVNEIITNSLKYGLKTIELPVIRVELTQSIIGHTTLTLSDNGVGYDKAKWKNPVSMGIELIKTLTEQLDGNISLELKNNSTKYILSFNAKLK
jgi:two-component sensor histidine kinase/ligand-binding sensor domain-containing protein